MKKHFTTDGQDPTAWPDTEPVNPAKGVQRLSVERLDRWLAREYGMFIHFGLATFSQRSFPHQNDPDQPMDLYRPDQLDTDQWAQVARDAGMTYAILTARHGTGFSLWPTEYTDFHVGNSPVTTDVVDSFVESCRKYGIRPALYYAPGASDLVEECVHCSFNKLDEVQPYASRKYMDMVLGQVGELMTRYGDLEEIWFDGPAGYGPAGRQELYDHCANLQPDCVIAMNSAWEQDGRRPQVKKNQAWPTDVIVIENSVPPIWGNDPWRKLFYDRKGKVHDGGLDFYLPVESCGVVSGGTGKGWFWSETISPYTDQSLLGVRLLCKERNANCVLNVMPDSHGRIAQTEIDALTRLSKNYSMFSKPAL